MLSDNPTEDLPAFFFNSEESPYTAVFNHPKNWFLSLCLFIPLTCEGKSRASPPTGLYDSRSAVLCFMPSHMSAVCDIIHGFRIISTQKNKKNVLLERLLLVYQFICREMFAVVESESIWRKQDCKNMKECFERHKVKG